MKVLYFTRTQSPHDLRFTKALASTNHQVYVLCLEPDPTHIWPNDIQEIAWQGIDTKHGWLAMLSQIGRLKRGLRLMKPDLVHAGPIQGPAYLTALAAFHPLVSMSWGSDLMLDANRNLATRLITRFTLKHTDILVGDCACVGGKAQSFGFNQKNYLQFPWGVDLQHFTPNGSASLREKLGWQNEVVLLSTRALEPLYGVDGLLAAFGYASRKNPRLRLMLFGKGSLEADFRQLVPAYDLQGKVYFGGNASLEELPDVYRSADVYLSASHSDGTSVSLMEALACGLPVIVSDIPGNLEWVSEGRQGWLFKDGDVDDFSQKILLAASQIKELDQIKNGNRVLAEERADWPKNFKVLLKAYDLAFQTVGSHD
jgi:glycosyltransferase involved in cell wall biosynthesis